MTLFTLTIGPIYETMKKARKTRDLWASSYMFSYLIREIATEIKRQVEEDNYIMPHLGGNPQNGAGLYPDRIMAIIPVGKTFEELRKISEDTIEAFAAKVALHITPKKATAEEKVAFEKTVIDYYKSYIRCATKEIEVTGGHNINMTVYPQLDQLELKPKIPLATEDYVSTFITNINGSDLVGDGFKEEDFWQNKSNNIRFESTLEVSAKTLELLHEAQFKDTIDNYILNKTKSEREDEKDIIDAFNNEEKFGEDFRPHQKYIAIISADGDDIGKTIKQIATDKGKIKKFSNFLFDFASKATKKVKEYGGLPIYMGGDDMLFFSPVGITNKQNVFSTIFDLVKTLDKLFSDEYNELNKLLELGVKEENFPTLSFGISITYYKYPLYEALTISHDNLWYKAKKESSNGKKNKIAFSLQKHSGQLIEAIIEKSNTVVYDEVQKFIKTWANNTGESNEFLNSLTYKLEHLAPLFDAATEQGLELNEFFNNQFNEAIHLHTIADKENFIISLAKLTHEIYKSKADVKLLYATLRFIHFLNTKDDK